MNCKRCMQLISAYIDGELNKKEHTEVKRHLEDCSQCFKEFTALYEMEGLIEVVGKEEPPQDFTQRFEAKIPNIIEREFFPKRRKEVFPLPKLPRFAYAAMASILIVSVGVLFRWLVFNSTFESLPIAQVAAVIGELKVQKEGFKAWQSIPVYSPLQPGDRLSTAAQDRATLLLTNGSEITLAENSVLILKKGNMPKDKAKEEYFLELERGELRAKVVNLKGRFTVIAGQAQAEVKGTEFILKLLGEGTSILTVTDGEVMYSTSKSSVVVKKGTQAVAKGEAIEVHPISAPVPRRSGSPRKASAGEDRFYDDFAISVDFNNIKVVFPPQGLSIKKIPVVDLTSLGFWQIAEKEARKIARETEIQLPAEVRKSNRITYYTNTDSQLISIDVARFRSGIEALRWWRSIRFEGTVYSSWKHSLTDEGLWAFRYPSHASVLCFKEKWILAINVGSKSPDYILPQAFVEEKIRDLVLRLVVQQNLKLIEEWLGSGS